MPELPEVETIARSLRPYLTGRTIRGACFRSRLVLVGDPDATAARLRGRRIESVERRGKFLLLELGGAVLAIHLGMTGKLLWESAPGPHMRALFTLDTGTLVYDDIRQFGRIELAEGPPERVASLGPDPLAITEEEFVQRAKAHRGVVKPLLLNQAFMAGLGNIYVDEALFRARVHPKAKNLSSARWRRVYRAIREVLEAAIASRGSSISDYVDGEGRAGSFQQQHNVYGRAGEPCPVCGKPIRRIVIAQRGTHYCPGCQRM